MWRQQKNLWSIQKCEDNKRLYDEYKCVKKTKELMNNTNVWKHQRAYEQYKCVKTTKELMFNICEDTKRAYEQYTCVEKPKELMNITNVWRHQKNIWTIQGDRDDAQEITAFWKYIFNRKSLSSKYF